MGFCAVLLDHYEFRDSTGAEYRLDVYTNGIWSSKESIYVYYDPSLLSLHFTDGSTWVFGCTSAGTEQDSGTMYPSNIYDSNGNKLAISYANGVGVSYSYSSSRIYAIEDVRGYGASVYTFTYNSDPIPHLTGISNKVGTAENYTFQYASNQALNSPFSPSINFGNNWTFLASVANGIPLTTSFTYDSSGSGELDRVTFPYGGHIRWGYGGSYGGYGSGRTLREINSGRFLSMAAGAPELQYTIGFDTSPSTFHTFGDVSDPDGNGLKSFNFGTDSTQPGYGLLAFQEGRLHQDGNSHGGHFETYTWTTDSAGNHYIGTLVATEDYTLTSQISKQTTQTLDQYGNVTQMQVYDYGNLTTPARTYTNTYLNTSAYTSHYILNRLATSTVTDGTHSTTLVTNTYDCCALTDAPGILEHYSGDNTTFLTRGNVTTSVTPAGTRTMNYDIAGNVVLHNDNNLTTNVTVSSTTNYAAPTTITTNSLSSNLVYSGFLGLSSLTNQPNGDTGSIVYDTSARPHTTTSPLGAVTTFTYNDSASPPTKVATTNGHWVRTTMDGLGRTIKTEAGNGSTTVSVVDTQYVSCGCSPLGKMGQQSQPYAPNGAVYWTVYHYDGLGRTTSVVAPDGSTTSYGYSSNTVTVTDPAGKYKTFTMDAFGNLTQVQEPDPTLGLVSTTYTYDILNHLIQVSMPRGSNTQTRTFNYLNGTTVGIDLLSATNPENGTVTYTYNTDHTLHTKTDALNQVFTYSYDNYKRLTQIMVGSTVLRTFIYDTNTLDSTFSGSYTAGRLVAVQHPAFTPGQSTSPNSMQFIEMYNYTQPGQTGKKRLQVLETFPYAGQNFTRTTNLDAAYTYDIEGKIASVNYPTTYSWNGTQLVANPGPTYTYSFDVMDRPTGLKDQSNNTAVSNVQYNPANQLLAISYFGSNETRQYNNLNQMTNLTIGSDTITYTFPAGGTNGKISQQSDSVSGETVTYQYDSLNRLLSGTSNKGWSETYGYDAFGNLLSKTPTGGAPTLSQAVNPATNEIVGQSYDGNGNQTVESIGAAGV